MRLIDADRLLSEKMKSKYYHLPNGDIAIPLIDIEHAPTIEPEPRWIPCSERLPEEGSWAIWCSSEGSIQVARWKIDALDHFFPDQGFFELEDAVAWMPLPEPYKAESEDK